MSTKDLSYKRASIQFWTISVLCVVAIAAELLAWLHVLQPPEETRASWVQRSGAITTIFAAYAQYRHYNFSESTKGTVFAESWSLHWMFNSKREALARVIAFLTLWGAIVWGYGDIIVRCFS